MRKIIITIGLFVFCLAAKAQIEGTSLPSLPSVTTAEMNGAINVNIGSSVFNTDDQRVYRYTTSGWVTTTDSQNLELSNNTLSLTNDNTTVDLSPFANNDTNELTDLDLSGNILTLTNPATGGNSVDLSGIAADNIYSADGSLTDNRAVTQNNFDLNFDTNTLVVSGDNNRVGIGTGNPQKRLHILSDTDGEGFLKIDGDGGVGEIVGTQLRAWSGSNANNLVMYGAIDIGGATMDAIIQVPNATSDGTIEAVRIDAGTGNMGVGTNTPDAKLDIENGTVRFSDYGAGTITGTATNILGVDVDGDVIEVNATTFNDNPFNDKADDTVAENGDASIYLPGNRMQVGADGAAAVAITLNDGGGNANITFNHAGRIPDSNGSSARIRTDVDGTTAGMGFQLADNVTAGAAPTMTTVINLRTNNIDLNQDTDITGNLDVNGTGRVRNLPAAADSDQLVTADANGNLRQVNSLKASRIFYPPSIAIDASALVNNATIDLYQEYLDQYGGSASNFTASAGAPGTVPTYGRTELYYYVTYADPAVLNIDSIDANGNMQYDVIGTPPDYNALINVVFVVR